MNDTALKITCDKFKALLDECKIPRAEICKRIGIHASLMSNLGTAKGRKRLSGPNIERMLKAINSGLKLSEYLDKYCPVDLAEKPEPEAWVSVKPEAYQKRIQELSDENEQLKTALRKHREYLSKPDEPNNAQDVEIKINIDLFINGKKVQL